MEFVNTVRTWFTDFHFNSYRSINSIKTALACFIGLLVAKFPGLPVGQWILISIVVVMSGQTNVGGALQKAYMRIIGTISGAFVAGISVYFFAHNPFLLSIILIVSCAVFAYIAAAGGNINSGAGTLGSATVIMILLANPPSLSIVFLRPLEIIIGIIIAVLVNRLIAPIHATARLKNSMGSTLQEFRKLYLISSDPTNSKEAGDSLVISKKIEENILKNFAAQRTLLGESKSEHYKLVKKTVLYSIMDCERRLYRAIMLSNYTLHGNAVSQKIIQALPAYQAYNQQFIDILTQLNNTLKAKTASLATIAPLPFEVLSAELRRASLAQPFENAVYVDSCIISIKLLTDEMQNLINVVSQLWGE